MFAILLGLPIRSPSVLLWYSAILHTAFLCHINQGECSFDIALAFLSSVSVHQNFRQRLHYIALKVQFVLLKPRVDDYILEQRVLLRTPEKFGDSSGLCPEVSFLTGGARRQSMMPQKDKNAQQTRASTAAQLTADNRMRAKRAEGRQQSGNSAHGAYEQHKTDAQLKLSIV